MSGGKEEGFRAEADSMGEVRLPSWAYWGAQTQRAVENFGISPLRIPPGLIEALGLIKRYAAEVNGELGLLDKELAGAIVRAADEMIAVRASEDEPAPATPDQVAP